MRTAFDFYRKSRRFPKCVFGLFTEWLPMESRSRWPSPTLSSVWYEFTDLGEWKAWLQGNEPEPKAWIRDSGYKFLLQHHYHAPNSEINLKIFNRERAYFLSELKTFGHSLFPAYLQFVWRLHNAPSFQAIASNWIKYTVGVIRSLLAHCGGNFNA